MPGLLLACIQFSDKSEVELSLHSLELPTVERSMSRVVLQLGFKRLSRGMVPAGSELLRRYALSQAFLSHPY